MSDWRSDVVSSDLCLDDQLIASCRKLSERRLAFGKAQDMLAGRAGRAADSVHRHVQRPPGLAPPLAHVAQPFRAFVLLEVHVIPDGEVGRLRKARAFHPDRHIGRSEEHTSELQSLMRNSYAVFCLKKKNIT